MGLALPQSRVWSFQKDNHYVQNILKTIIDASRCWKGNTLTSASMESQLFLVLKYVNWIVSWSLLCITDGLADFIGKIERNTNTAPLGERMSMER